MRTLWGVTFSVLEAACASGEPSVREPNISREVALETGSAVSDEAAPAAVPSSSPSASATPTPSLGAKGVALASPEASQGPPPADKEPATDAEWVDRWFAQLEAQLMADAERLLRETVTTKEAAAVLMGRFNPSTFRPRWEFFPELADPVRAAAAREALVRYSEANPDDMTRRMQEALVRLEAPLRKATEHVNDQLKANAKPRSRR